MQFCNPILVLGVVKLVNYAFHSVNTKEKVLTI